MRNLRLLDAFRNVSPRLAALYGGTGDETCGSFYINSPIDKAPLCVVASSGEGWDHVSVSRRNRPPNWTEMEYVKRLFFKDDETAMQLHVPVGDHINNHPHCLHLWRPHAQEIPRPPGWMVGLANVSPQEAAKMDPAEAMDRALS